MIRKKMPDELFGNLFTYLQNRHKESAAEVKSILSVISDPEFDEDIEGTGTLRALRRAQKDVVDTEGLLRQLQDNA